MRLLLYIFLSFILLPSTLSSNEDRVNYVSVGEKGVILISNDGINWKKITRTISGHNYEVFFENNTFVIIGQYGSILTSVDGIVWDEINKQDHNELSGITYGNGKFIVVQRQGGVLSSLKGDKWELINLDYNINFDNVFFANSIYFGIDGRTILQSKDGINWELYEVGVSGLFNLQSGVYGKDKYVLVGNNVIANSENGIEWNVQRYNVNEFNHITFSGKFFLITGTHGLIFFSDNGENWYKCDDKLCNKFNNFNSSIFSNGKFIVVGNNGLIIHTEDLIKWKSSPKVTKYDLYSIVKR